LFVLFPSFLMFDRLLRIEYEVYRRYWEADGKPVGFFWIPNEVKSFHGVLVNWRSSVASRRCALVWLVLTPKWVKKNETAARAIFWWRFFVVFWILALVGLGFLTFR